MFIEKIRKLSQDLGVSYCKMQDVKLQSLLYGMKLVKKPGALKRALRKVGADSKQATPMWNGNAYLLLTLPRILVDRKTKIINLEDYQFAKKHLTPEQLRELHTRVQNIPDITPEQILEGIKDNLTRRAYASRFLPTFDPMHEMGDIRRDMMCEALTVINKEMTNFRTHNPEEIYKYIGYCFDGKSKTYVKAKAPRWQRVGYEDALSAEDSALAGEECVAETTVEFMQDMQKLLSDKERLAVLLLLDQADERMTRKFSDYLSTKGRERAALSPVLLKKHITGFVGDAEVFDRLQQNQDFHQYLRAV